MRVALIVITIVVLAIAGTALALGWEGALTRRRNPVTVDAYVAGDRTPLSSHLAGYVRTVPVHDNQSARAGDTIVQMVDDDYRAMAAEAQAQADASRTALAALGEKREVLRQQVVQAQDTVMAATDRLVYAANEVHRQQELLPTVTGLLQSLQSAQADLRRTEATRAQAAAQVMVNQSQLDLLEAQILQAKAQTDEADARSALARIALGYTQLDIMLGGGLPEASTTMVMGPSGTGKTTLGLNFLTRSSEAEPGLLFGFYETPKRIDAKVAGVCPALRDLIDSGVVKVLWQPPTDDLLDAYGERLLQAVHHRKVRRLFIDGLGAFQVAATSSGAGRIGMFLTALMNEMRVLGVTTVYALEVPDLMGPMIRTSIGDLSSLAENLVMLRFVEVGSQLHRLLFCGRCLAPGSGPARSSISAVPPSPGFRWLFGRVRSPGS